jgi:deoxyribodipyrimidine photo-lyase
VREVVSAVEEETVLQSTRSSEGNRSFTLGCEKLLSELGWREFSYALLFHNPDCTHQPLQPKFAHFPWQKDDKLLSIWQKGRTGYPIVDAGMRELWHTGWMHNRVRMIVASFLVKHLMQPWQEGAAWFMQTLLDADLASNTQGWQWTAGCGADASPFFRVFNPVSQGKKFDPHGDYVRRWIPELKDVPLKQLHEPWLMTAAQQTSSGCNIGQQYPQPIVELAAGRQRALDAWKSLAE